MVVVQELQWAKGWEKQRCWQNKNKEKKKDSKRCGKKLVMDTNSDTLTITQGFLPRMDVTSSDSSKLFSMTSDKTVESPLTPTNH